MPIVQIGRLLTKEELEEVQKKLPFQIHQEAQYSLIGGPVIVFKYQPGVTFDKTTREVEEALGDLCKKL